MAAYILGACEPDGSEYYRCLGSIHQLESHYAHRRLGWNVQALPDVTFQYRGPTTEQANACSCSSVAYALSSACGFCQGAGYPECAY